jgi:hypothetical protein
MFLPLIFVTIFTELSVKIDSLLGIFLFLVAIILILHYMSKYGSIYKLAFVSGNNIVFLEEHKDVYIALLAGSAMYAVAIYSLLTQLLNSPSPLSKIGISIVIALLLIEVLPNRKYENSIKLIGKILRES